MVLNTTQYKEVFTKDKTTFEMLQTEEKRQDVNRQLTEIGIGKLAMFRELAEDEDLHKIVCMKALTLLIFPKTNRTDETAEETKKQLKTKDLTSKKTYYATDILDWEEEGGSKKGWVVYFPHKNLLISTINPFADKKVLDCTMGFIKELKPKFYTEQELFFQTFVSKFKATLGDKKQELKDRYKGYESSLRDLADKYKKTIADQQIAQVSLEAVDNFLSNTDTALAKELEEIKKLPVVKDIKIGENLEISFGMIHITAKVKTGEEKKDGFLIPKAETKKIKIGELKFVIGERILVTNTKAVDGYEHPHASHGEMCFGEDKLKVEDMLATFQLTKLVKYLYAWAFSYNEGSCFHKIQNFYAKNGAE